MDVQVQVCFFYIKCGHSIDVLFDSMGNCCDADVTG